MQEPTRTRLPAPQALGSIELWTRAEAMMKEALDGSGRPWKLNPGDGAFYGPKIDIKVFDALGRRHQCATIQLDFQLPIRFNLRYHSGGGGKDAAGAAADDAAAASPAAAAPAAASSAAAAPPAAEAAGEAAATPCHGGHGHGAHKSAVEAAIARVQAGATDDLPAGYERPVMIHRAILGSVERMMAVLIEHTAGKFPFWLSPRQICIVPVAQLHIAYARDIGAVLEAEGFFVDVEDSTKTMNKKIRDAQLAQYNFVLVVGSEEAADRSVNVRTRANEVLGKKSLADAVAFFKQLAAEFK